jgi:hypothetical protein
VPAFYVLLLLWCVLMSSVDIAMPTGLASDVVLGVLFFDVPALHQEGWLCIAGREPIRVAGTYQIPDNYALITNLDFDQHRLAGLALGRFYNRDWFPRRMDQLLLEFAIQDAPAEVQARFFAILFGRLMFWSARVFGVSKPDPYGYVRTIRKAWEADDLGVTPAPVLEAAANALHYYSGSELAPRYGQFLNSSLYMPRMAHMREVLGHDVPRPGASWRRLLPREIPKLEADIPRWISRYRPMLVQVVVRETHSALHRLINPGADLRREQSQRLWRTSDEILMLCFFCRLRILDAWEVDETLCFIKESDGLGKALALSDEAQEAAEVSVSYGLFLDALWKAAATYRHKPGGVKHTPPHTVFIRALDVLNCLMTAIDISELRESGEPWANVTGFGSGTIRVSTPTEQHETDQMLAELSLRFGLMPPIPQATVFSKWDEEFLTDADALQRALYLGRDWEGLEEGDNCAIQSVATAALRRA